MSRRPRVPTILLLACALFLRLWVPAGWMPAANGAAFAIQPCAAAPAMPMAHHGSPAHKDAHDGDCAFAPHHGGIAQLSVPPAPPMVAAHSAPPPQAGLLVPFATGPPSLPPPSTGPPALA